MYYSGETKISKNSKNASIWRGGGKNFQKNRKTHLETVVKNKCTKFEQNRSMVNVFNFGGTKMPKKHKKYKYFWGD